MTHPKPIIGIVGGIGAGKSFVADVLKNLGCGVIDSDKAARAAIERPDVRAAIHMVFGDHVFADDGALNRKALAAEVFSDPQKRKQLEGITHPVITEMRLADTQKMVADPSIKAIIWDAPLLFEAGLDQDCDAVIFVDAPLEVRQKRVISRGWSPAELEKREKSQISLDKKRQLADYIVNNGEDPETSRLRIQQVFSQIIVLSRT